MKGKTILITGASSGIGKVTAYELARMGATVVMLCRNIEKSELIKTNIIKATENQSIDLIEIDLSDLESVRKAAVKILEKYDKIDVLINNAGGYYTKRMLSVDGYEYTLAANHLGHFLLTNLLLDRIKQSPRAKIINVSSAAHRTGHINFNDLMLERNYHGFKAYSQSKLANILFTKELAKKLKGTGITVNAVHPGAVSTNFGKNTPGFFKSLIQLGGPLLRTPEKGAETTIYLASSSETNDITGEYFVNKKIKKSQSESYDEEIAKKLWDVSEELTELNLN